MKAILFFLVLMIAAVAADVTLPGLMNHKKADKEEVAPWADLRNPVEVPVPGSDFLKKKHNANEQEFTPLRWVIIRSFIVVSDEKDEVPAHNHRPGQLDEHCAPSSAALCLKLADPARTDCLISVTRRLDREIRNQQDQIETMAYMLENDVRFFGIQMTHFIFVLCLIAFIATLLRCLRKKCKKSEQKTEEDVEALTPEKQVVTYDLSGTATPAQAYHMVPSEKTPPVITSQPSAPERPSFVYPAVVYPANNSQ
eukprot:TRINITY_DN13947_c0_g1_i1.p1 TRINITY_DN13947_c0_g1~~TRINITY_DN13947_c0_g1_i1.p1  ORF type:complete len:254 (-),score=69.13 TRINITY_DN13947_c0_g1_i1:31-792(-)